MLDFIRYFPAIEVVNWYTIPICIGIVWGCRPVVEAVEIDPVPVNIGIY